MNPEAEAFALVDRTRRTHQKDVRKQHDEDARQARIHRKRMMEQEDDEDDWRSYVNR